jgi:hypothetical protein
LQNSDSAAGIVIEIRPADVENRLKTAGLGGAVFEPGRSIVIFFFEQEGRYTRCEVLPLPDGASELIVTQPEGAQTVEVLSGSEVTRRISELRESMLQAGWWGPVGREF